MCTYGTIMSVLIPTMIGKHHLKLDMPGEFSNKVLQKCLTTTLWGQSTEGRMVGLVVLLDKSVQTSPQLFQ